MAKSTYRASTIIPLVITGTVDKVFFNIIGSATRKVTVKRIRVSGMSLTAVAYLTINAIKNSTASSGGTSSTLVTVPLNTGTAAGTAVVKAYTADPTNGTLVGIIASWRALWQATTAAAAGVPADHIFNFGDVTDEATNDSGVVLNGVAEELALSLPVVAASAGTMAIDIEWVEELPVQPT